MAEEVIGYCVKCKVKRAMADAQKVTMKNGRPAMKGKCPTCGTGMYKIMAKQPVFRKVSGLVISKERVKGTQAS